MAPKNLLFCKTSYTFVKNSCSLLVRSRDSVLGESNNHKLLGARDFYVFSPFTSVVITYLKIN